MPDACHVIGHSRLRGPTRTNAKVQYHFGLYDAITFVEADMLIVINWKADMRGADMRGADMRGASSHKKIAKRAVLIGKEISR